MAKTDFFKLLGCAVMVSLIAVIAVKLAKQEGFRGVCPEGQVPDQSGKCVEEKS
jgi:hypothetical protein